MVFCLHDLQLNLLSLLFIPSPPPSFSVRRPTWSVHPNTYFTRKQTFFLFRHNSPQWAMASSFTRFLDHTQRRTTVSRTPLDEWSARSRDFYLTTHNIPHRQTSMPPVGFEPTTSAGERPQTHALDRAATGTGKLDFGRKRLKINWTTLWDSDDTNCRYCARWQYSSRNCRVFCFSHRHYNGADTVNHQPRQQDRPAQSPLRHSSGLVPANELLLLYCYSAGVCWSSLLYEGKYCRVPVSCSTKAECISFWSEEVWEKRGKK